MAQGGARAGVEHVEDSAIRRIKQYACCSTTITSKETCEVFCLAEAAKIVLRERAAIILNQAAFEPVLLQFSLDTTPVKTCQQVSKAHGDLRVKRAAKATQDYMVCQLFVTVRADSGGYSHTLLFRDPLRLKHGKTMRALASCARDSPGMRLTCAQPGRICLRHQVHDRGITQSFTNAISGMWYTAACESQPTMGRTSEETVALHEWHTHVGCCAHDAHNGLKWAHQVLFNDKVALESVYVCISACRAAYMSAVEVLGTWLVDKLEPWPEQSLPASNEMLLLWTSLGVDPEIASSLAKYRLLWQDGRLLIDGKAREQADWLQEVSCALLGAWNFRHFTESRWCTVGSSCRALTCSLLLGYLSLLQYMREKGSLSEYEWNGCQRLGDIERQSVVIVGLASFLPEGFLLHVLKDSRVAKTQQKLQELLFEEYGFLDKLPSVFWEHLSRAANAQPETIRSSVIQGALVSWAFLEWRVLAVATELPWRLCAGDVSQNLEELLTLEECPCEPVSEKLYLLGKAGYNRDRLTQAVRLLSECSWTSAFTEKQHFRHHPDIGDNMLMARAFCYTFAQMVPGESKEDRKRQALVAQLMQKLKSNPNCITGRQVFLKHIMQKASTREASSSKELQYKRPRIMKLHGVHWEKLPLQAKLSYEKEANVLRAASQQQRAEEVASLRKEMAILRGTVGTSAEPKSSMLVSACALDKPSLQRLSGLLQDGTLKGCCRACGNGAWTALSLCRQQQAASLRWLRSFT